MQTVIGGPTTINSPPAWYSYRSSDTSHTTGEPLYVIDKQDPHGGSGKSLRYNIENTSYMNGGGLDLVLCNSGTCGWDEIHLRFYLKLEPNFDFHDGGSDFVKLFRLYTGVDVQNDDLAPSSTYATQADSTAIPAIKRSMLMVAYINTDAANDYRLSFSYFLGQLSGIDYIEIQKVPLASVFNFKDHLGEWIYYEIDAKLNTVGQNDGSFKVWVIPESNISSYDINNPTFTWDGLEIRSTVDRKWNTVILADNMSGQWERPVAEQTITYDDLIISTSHIGPFTPKGGINITDVQLSNPN
jgi:hypothetical protein